MVTGACGFIGSHLTERLIELGAGVSALVRYNSRNDRMMIELFPEETKRKISSYCLRKECFRQRKN